MSDFEIRLMTEHDLLEVVGIEETSALSRWGWEAYYEELFRPEAIALIASAQSSDAMVRGFIVARVAVDELHISNIGVGRDFRQKGIGGALLSEAITRGAERGARKCFLEVRASNEIAQTLYAKHGFETCGRRKNYYREPIEDALLYCVEL